MFAAMKRCGFWLIASGLFLSPMLANAQDLGSSNGLFRSPNPSSKKKTTAPAEKKPAAKTAPIRKLAAKPETAKNVQKNNVAKAASGAKTSVAKNTTAKDSAVKASAAKTQTAQVSTAKNTGSKKTPASKQLAARPSQNNIVITVGKPVTAEDERLFDRAIDDGNAARDERNYVAAESAYARARDLKPNDARAVYGLGNIFSDQQRWEESEKAYRRAISLEPDSPEAYVALSFVLTQPLVGANLSERYAEAEKAARRAIQLDASNALAHDQLGAALELGGHIKIETQDAYKRAIELDPNFALAYAHYGRLLSRKGYINESAAAYSDAIRLATDVPTMILVADVMQSQQRYSESEQLLRRALTEDAKNPTALLLLGRALTARGVYDEAETLLRKSVAVSPNSFVSYALLASLYSRRGNYDEAEKTLMQASRVASVNEKKRLAQEFETVGDGLMRAGKKRDAARVYRQAIKLDAEKDDLSVKLGKAEKS